MLVRSSKKLLERYNMKTNNLFWRRLDNSAKIFPMSTGKRYSTVFRLSVVLKEEIKPEILQKALLETRWKNINHLK